jgi:hypothetical protein
VLQASAGRRSNACICDALEVILKTGPYIYATVTGGMMVHDLPDRRLMRNARCSRIMEQRWFCENSQLGKSLGTNAPIEAWESSTVMFDDHNNPIDLFQLGSSGDDIGQSAAGYRERAPYEVNCR